VLRRGVDSGSKRVKVEIAESAANGLKPQLASIRFPGREPLEVKLSEAAPRASRRVSNLQLAAVNGGPLTVRQVRSSSRRSELEFLEARFEWSGELNAPLSEQLRPGELGTAHLRGAQSSLAQRIDRPPKGWLNHLIKRPESA